MDSDSCRSLQDRTPRSYPAECDRFQWCRIYSRDAPDMNGENRSSGPTCEEEQELQKIK